MSTPNYAEGLGQITANFNGLEADTSALIWSLIGDDKVGQIVTAQMPFRKLLDTLSALFKYRGDPELVAELDELIKRAQAINERRNMFVHSIWFDHLPGTLRRVKLKVSGKTGLKMDEEDIDPKELFEFSNDIGNCISALEQFRIKAGL